MKKSDDIASTVANLVFTPTLLAYGWIVVGYVTSGICLYVIALGVAYKTGTFEDFAIWPMISKIALYVGVPYIALGLYFSTRPIAYWMLIPLVIHAVLSIVAGLALRVLNSKSRT